MGKEEKLYLTLLDEHFIDFQSSSCFPQIEGRSFNLLIFNMLCVYRGEICLRKEN